MVLVLLGLTVQAGAAQVSTTQGSGVDAAESAGALSVETTWADPINESSVVAAGNLTGVPTNETATVLIEYRRQGTATWRASSRQTVETTGPFRTVLTGLESGATYEYRARAVSGSAGDNGTRSTFAVPDNPPTVKAQPPASVTEDSARLTASVGWLGGADSAEVVVAAIPSDGLDPTRTRNRTVTDDGSVTLTVDGLEPNATYDYVAHVSASDGDNATAGPVRFTTDTEFAVETSGAAAVNATALKVSGAAIDLGGADSADIGFEYRQRGASEWTATGWTTVTAPNGTSATLTGLAPNTTYEVRAVGTAVDNDLDDGRTLTVATDPAPAPDPAPTVTTTGPAAVSERFAGLTASVTGLGGAESADVLLELRPAGASDWRLVANRTVTEPRDVRVDYHELRANTTYEYRAVLVAADGDVATGDAVRFRTDTAFAVVTDGAAADNATAVTVRGTITDFGGAEGADAFVQYRRAGATEWTRANETRAALASEGSVAGTVTGLAPNATYEFRIRAVGTDEGQDFGAVVTATTAAPSDPAPAVRATGATDVTVHSANLTAAVDALGGAERGQVAFQLLWPDSSEWYTFETRNVTGPTDVNATFLDFGANTTYEYRVVLTADDGDEATSSPVALTTAEPIAVRTDGANAVNATAVAVNGTVTDFGDAEAPRGYVEYREVGTYGWTTVTETAVTADGNFHGTVTGLAPETTYEFRVRATAGEYDRDTGSVVTATTAADPEPVLTTTGAAAVTDESADLTATVTDLGGAESATVTVELRPAGGDRWTAVASRNVTASADLRVTADGLSANTTYEYRAVLTASDGDTAGGGVGTLATDAAFAVATESARAVDDTAVTVTGAVTDLGGADAATAVVEYRRAGATEWTTATRERLPAPGTVTATVDGLAPGTDYEVRVTASATDGDRDAGDALAVRADAALAVATVDATDVNGSAATLNGDLADLGGADTASVAIEYRARGDERWRTATVGNRSAPGEFDRTVAGLTSETTYEFRAVASASDGDEVTGETRTLTTEAVASGPAIEEFDLRPFRSPNPHLAFLASWSVADDDGDLESVTVEVIDDDGEVVDSATTDAAGVSHGGANYFRLKHVRDETFTVRLVVTDEGGERTTDTRTVTE
ncbi:fibronectin type III domain-containing protein [Halosimplex pelagicum]|uniref:Fibronectin type III domain-containing protein n=1 Tax=Halosimplex pelagicum TaxID=869886 RepID=A0A7D5P6K3_9EURY|nr:fibronectin type III domain-containing protein [Halosimplex pelagicum]QLH80421.1 fibronectin type III domain-containing protein [Halosimplex pelagicum]